MNHDHDKICYVITSGYLTAPLTVQSMVLGLFQSLLAHLTVIIGDHCMNGCQARLRRMIPLMLTVLTY